MARQKRLVVPGYPHHVRLRGNDGRRLFFSPEEFRYFRSLLFRFKKDRPLRIHHYCLMTNHVHLVATPDTIDIFSTFVQKVALAYGAYFRSRHPSTGHLWEGPFRSNVIDTDRYFLSCGKYVEANPVRAGMVNDPRVYEYSSAKCYCEGLPDPLVTPTPWYYRLGTTEEERRRAYSLVLADERLVNKKALATKPFIGGTAFVTKMEKRFGVKNQF